MIQGISHITFIVSNLERSSELLKLVFDAQEIYSSEEKTFSISKEKFFLIGDIWVALMEGDPLADRSYNHIAFKVNDEDYEKYESRVRALGLEIKDSRSRVEGEGRSLYFYDFDNHLFEIHTGTLAERLSRYKEAREV